MNEKIKVFLKDNESGKIHEVYFPTIKHAEAYVANENNFMNKSFEIIFPTDENNLQNVC